jgi:hypothetical protein
MNSEIQSTGGEIAKPERNLWHIHVDAASMGEEFRRFLQETGFRPDNFVPGSGQYEPYEHWTWKGKKEDARRYKEIMGAVRKFVESRGYSSSGSHVRPNVYAGNRPDIFRGYVEAEYVASDIELPAEPFIQKITPPVRLALRKLLLPFRASEVHVAMDKERSDPRTLDAMREMGFYEVLMPKPNEERTAIIFTVQSEKREQIQQLIPIIEEFLRKNGGVSHGSIKEEIISDWLLSDPDVTLPPVLTDDSVPTR